MHVITICPKCNEDFMYHTSETHLIQQSTKVDEVENNEIEDMVICQKCYNKLTK